MSIDGLQKFGRQVNAKLHRALGGAPRTGFSADYDACVALIEMDPPDLWVSGRAWEILRERYKRTERYERARLKLEEHLIWRFGGATEIEAAYPTFRRNADHPTVCFRIARAQPTLAHVSDGDILKAIRPPHISRRHNEPPRRDADEVLNRLRYQHGLWCSQCKSAVEDHYDGIYAFPRYGSDHARFWWARLGICEDCARNRAAQALSRRERAALRDREFERIQAENARLKTEERERTDREFKARREAARVARERGKIDRAAAYELVKELGLLDQARSRIEGRG